MSAEEDPSYVNVVKTLPLLEDNYRNVYSRKEIAVI